MKPHKLLVVAAGLLVMGLLYKLNLPPEAPASAEEAMPSAEVEPAPVPTLAVDQPVAAPESNASTVAIDQPANEAAPETSPDDATQATSNVEPSQPKVLNSDEKFVEFDDEHLQQARTVWLGTCEGCHAYGIAGSPNPMEAGVWTDRIAKGKEVLYDHAINGFFGPNDTMMPERGGNPELTDAQVKSAVDYMVALAIYYTEKK